MRTYPAVINCTRPDMPIFFSGSFRLSDTGLSSSFFPPPNVGIPNLSCVADLVVGTGEKAWALPANTAVAMIALFIVNVGCCCLFLSPNNVVSCVLVFMKERKALAAAFVQPISWFNLLCFRVVAGYRTVLYRTRYLLFSVFDFVFCQHVIILTAFGTRIFIHLRILNTTGIG